MSGYQQNINDPVIASLRYYANLLGKDNIQSLDSNQLGRLQSIVGNLIANKSVRQNVSKPSSEAEITNQRLFQDVQNRSFIIDRQPIPMSNKGDTTRQFRSDANMKNPYEYGSKQQMLDPMVKTTYQGDYYNNPDLISEMGLNDTISQNGNRNFDLESSLIQGEATHLPGQNSLTQHEVNRFNKLPFNPQNPSHIVWEDNMPRGGYSTRINNNKQYSL